jgi:predicted TIM-barrel fold metal-dependent hydrolase
MTKKVVNLNALPGIDCHNHIIDPRRFPFAPFGGYRPREDEEGRREALAAALEANEMRHALVIQPSCYGSDNRAVLDALAWRPELFRAIAVLEPETSESELEQLEERGFVGVRFNLPYDPAALVKAEDAMFLARLKARGWFVQVYGRDSDWQAAAPLLQRSGVKLLIDHMGLESAAGGMNQKGFQAVLSLGQDNDAVIKLSAPFRSSRHPPNFEDIDPFVDAILKHFGCARCIWGSDWPFLNSEPRPTYGAVLSPVFRWFSQESDQIAVLWDNPCRLFGFDREIRL